jgi:hypothetical protein
VAAARAEAQSDEAAAKTAKLRQHITSAYLWSLPLTKSLSCSTGREHTSSGGTLDESLVGCCTLANKVTCATCGSR